MGQANHERPIRSHLDVVAGLTFGAIKEARLQRFLGVERGTVLVAKLGRLTPRAALVGRRANVGEIVVDALDLDLPQPQLDQSRHRGVINANAFPFPHRDTSVVYPVGGLNRLEIRPGPPIVG